VAKEYEEIKKIIEESTANKKRTCIVQKYIHNPLLINKRKFDIRAYAFFTSINGSLKGYWYADGYLRTSCREFTLNNLANRMIHLTNDAVQKHAEDYGKFEPGNKLSYNDFQNYLDKHYSD
jgi:tubulin--tyrosine ligase